MAHQKDVYFVIGGSGFLGRHIVQQLLDRGDVVSVFDIVQRYDDVPFYSGDISDKESVSSALRHCGATCIIHTASPPVQLPDTSIYWKVNVDGTNAVIAAAVDNKVRKLVYTSSAGVVFNGTDIIDGDERLPFPEVPMDVYNETKSKAEEAVLAANGKGGLLTVALRPAGIFGPGDRQAMTGFYNTYEGGKTHFQIGDNNNLFDWTYVGNVALAHLLAADKLETQPPAPPLSSLDKIPTTMAEVPSLTPDEEQIVSTPLQYVNLTTGKHRIPTCEARPLGPYVTKPPNADKIEAAYYDTNQELSNRPVIRTKFDPLSETSIKRSKLSNPDVSPLQVAGQVFFITNGEPCYFWDFLRLVWQHLDVYFPGKRSPRKIFGLPRSLGMVAATGAEWYYWLTGQKAQTFTRFTVKFTCASRWHNIEKARRVLGYEPEVSIEEGVKRMVEWWHGQYLAGQHSQKH